MKEKILEHFKKDTYAQLLGMVIEEVEDGYARVSMQVTENMLNFHGTANGGAIFSLADVAFACASNSDGNQRVGITMNIHYLKAGMVNEKLIAIAKEDIKSNRLGSYRIEVFNQAEELVAIAEGMVYRTKHRFV